MPIIFQNFDIYFWNYFVPKFPLRYGSGTRWCKLIIKARIGASLHKARVVHSSWSIEELALGEASKYTTVRSRTN